MPARQEKKVVYILQIWKCLMPRKPSRKLLIKKLDDTVKQLVKIRDNYTCQKCHKVVTGTNCHASHVIPVSSGNKLRWDLLNLKVLCYHDHINWWHKNPLEACEWFKNKFPDRWAYLESNKGIAQFTVFDLEELLRVMKARLKHASL